MDEPTFPPLLHEFPQVKVKQTGNVPPSICASCVYWWAERQQSIPGQSAVVAPCRRFPPSVAFLINPRALAGEMPMTPAKLPWPVMERTEWCGEYSYAARR